MDSISIDQVIELISKTYSPLKDNCKVDLRNGARLLSFDKASVLVKEGQIADKMYFIVKGCARAFYLKEGKDITDWFAFENDFITSIHSFFLNVPSPHYIELLEPTTFLEISKDTVLELCDKHHDFDRLGRISATNTMLKLQQRIVSIQFETAFQKYKSLLSIRPDITQRVPLTHIASYLGITLETLSRIRNPSNGI